LSELENNHTIAVTVVRVIVQDEIGKNGEDFKYFKRTSRRGYYKDIAWDEVNEYEKNAPDRYGPGALFL